MISVNEALGILNNKGYKTPPFIGKWRQTYFGMSLHTTGACPSFKSLATGETRQRSSIQSRGTVYPPGYVSLNYQSIFTTYLLNQHPREPDDIFNWRLSQYRPYTRTPFRKIIDVIKGAIFQDSNYTIDIDDKDDADFIFGNNFNGTDLITYVKNNIEWIVEDPNGVFITIPSAPYYDMLTPKVEAQVFFIPSKNIINLTSDEILFVIKDIAWLVNNQDYFRFQKNSATDKYEHIDHTQKGYYSHQFGRIPAITAGGIWNTQGWFDSWLLAAKAIADDYIGVKSGLQLLNKEAVHPIIVEAESDCPDCDPSGRHNEPCDITPETPNGFRLVRCPTCNGTHSVSHNPGQRMIVPADKMNNKLVQIIGFDMKPNEFLSSEIDKLYDAMLEALHLYYTDTAQSAIAKDRDMETRYQFIQNISNDLFDRVITGLLQNILGLRNVSVNYDGSTTPEASPFEITKPTQFHIKTASQLLADYQAASDSKMPDYVKSRCLEDYVDKQFGGSELMKRKVEIIGQMDIISCTSEADKQTRLLCGAISSRQYQFNVNLPTIIDSIIRLKGRDWFMDSMYDEIKSNVDTLFALIEPIAVTPKAETSQVKLTEN